MIILVTGGTTFIDQEMALLALTSLYEVYPFTTLVHGDAVGADTIAGNIANAMDVGIDVIACPCTSSDWDTYGKGAGHRRNQLMLDEHAIDFVVAFPGRGGTLDMTRRATAAGIGILWAIDLAYPGDIPF